MALVSLDGETSLLNMACVSKDHLDKNVGTNTRILISVKAINIIMHIKDIIKEAPAFSKGRPEVFLDMDGVVADFFSEYAKMANVENYRMIPGELAAPILDKMQGTDFFYRLPKFPTADALVNILTKTFGHYNICSSPLRGDHENSDKMKRAWIKENLKTQPKRIVITPNKAQDAPAVQADGTPNILIDDRNTNITQWEQAGGLGIKYQADEDGLDTVIEGLKRAFEVIRGQREYSAQNIISKDRGGDTIAQQEINESTLSDHEDELRDFVKWTCDKLKIKKMPRLEFQDSKESGDQKKTAHFDMQDGMIWIYTGNRNLADIMRSVAHELTHYKQDEKGQVTPDQSYPGSPIEQQADAVAGYLMKLYMDKDPGVLE